MANHSKPSAKNAESDTRPFTRSEFFQLIQKASLPPKKAGPSLFLQTPASHSASAPVPIRSTSETGKV